jgi:uncharacterized membrane protein
MAVLVVIAITVRVAIAFQIGENSPPRRSGTGCWVARVAQKTVRLPAVTIPAVSAVIG